MFNDPFDDDDIRTIKDAFGGRVSVWPEEKKASYRYPAYTPYLWDAFSESNDALFVDLFEQTKTQLSQCRTPRKKILVLEAFEYDFVKDRKLLKASHEEIRQALVNHEEHMREVAQDIFQRFQKEEKEEAK